MTTKKTPPKKSAPKKTATKVPVKAVPPKAPVEKPKGRVAPPKTPQATKSVSLKKVVEDTIKAPLLPSEVAGPTANYIRRTSREYSIYVCSTRAIPSIEDGLKHGQRIALWLLRNRAEKLKTSALSGLMAYERLYVHGDVSANNAIGLLAAPYKNNIPLIEGLGQFGSRAAPVEGIGAPRYTEVRRSKAAELMLYRDLDLVPLEDNYDGSNQQPKHFLPLIPTVLLNGVEGIAVGWATSILPRDPKALVQATQDALRGKKLKTIPPKFNLYDIDIVERGPNQWEFRGKAEIVDSSTVHITELPPGMSIDKLRADLIAMEENGAIVGFTDRSTEEIDVTVQFKRGSLKGSPATTANKTEIVDGHVYSYKEKTEARPTWTSEDAIKFFKLSEKVTERIVVVDWGGERISTYENAEKVIESFAQWRLGWYTRRFEKMFEDANYELLYWDVLRVLFADGFTARLGKFPDRGAMEEDVRAVVKKRMPKTWPMVDDRTIDRVVNLPTYRWTKAFEAEIQAKIDGLVADMNYYAETLEDPEKLKQVYLDELEELKKKL